MILHIVSDDKFTDPLIRLMDNINYDEHEYYLITLKSDYRIKLINNSERIKKVSIKSREYKGLVKSAGNYNAIVIHFLDIIKARYVQDLPEGLNLVWISWGGDLYSLLKPSEMSLYDTYTQNLISRMNLRNRLNKIIKLAWLYTLLKNKCRIKAINNIIPKFKYYSTAVQEEKIIAENFLTIKAGFVAFNYGIISHLLDYTTNEKCFGCNILIGNSGTLTNNHIGIFNYLKNNLPDNIKVIVPLSYGQQFYINQVLKTGKRIFENKFLPLKEFLPLESYYNILKTCTVCIFPHYRQQGIGSLVLMLWLGAKVYLNNRNPFYKFCLRNGITVFSIEDNLFKNSTEDIFTGLDEAGIENNKRKIFDFAGEEAIRKRAQNFLKTVTGH